ncbi:MAG: hypothetical protein COA96_15870 [SAR86 cluster bacterium]|uniref:Uncharacterized protein n=1 Tax=SAR86 cluster bacterium TaxID=2030880 RepID=A0A2A5ALR9_9GAMM|nr:MAG: hypothetical protein COA96_15870 [SAR86 cluster bacterium]
MSIYFIFGKGSIENREVIFKPLIKEGYIDIEFSAQQSMGGNEYFLVTHECSFLSAASMDI